METVDDRRFATPVWAHDITDPRRRAALTAPALRAGRGDRFFSYRAGARHRRDASGSPITECRIEPVQPDRRIPSTDWTGEGGEAVFVLELAEESELSRIAFDTGGLNRNRKAPKGFAVELSNSSANSGLRGRAFRRFADERQRPVLRVQAGGTPDRALGAADDPRQSRRRLYRA
jgi:hypothetical protein